MPDRICPTCGTDPRLLARWQALEQFLEQQLQKYDVYWSTDAMKWRACREIQYEMRRLLEHDRAAD